MSYYVMIILQKDIHIKLDSKNKKGVISNNKYT